MLSFNQGPKKLQCQSFNSESEKAGNFCVLYLQSAAVRISRRVWSCMAMNQSMHSTGIIYFYLTGTKKVSPGSEDTLRSQQKVDFQQQTRMLLPKGLGLEAFKLLFLLKIMLSLWMDWAFPLPGYRHSHDSARTELHETLRQQSCHDVH